MRVSCGRDVLPETTLSLDAEPLPVLSETQIRARGLMPHPWRLVSVGDGGRRLAVQVAGQLRLQGTAVTENADEVSVTVYGLPVPSGSLIAHRIALVSVKLGGPLGERRLIDGSTGE